MKNAVKNSIEFLKNSVSVYFLAFLLLIRLLSVMTPFIFFAGIIFLGLLVFIDVRNYILITNLSGTNRQLQYIDELTQAIRKSTKLNEVLELVMKNLTKELGYDRVLIFSFEHKGYNKDVLMPITGLNMPMEKLENFYFRFDKAEDIVPKSAIEKKPYIVRNAKEDHRCSQGFVEMLNLGEFVVVPLIAKDTMVGALLADNKENKRSIKEVDLTPLTVFANQAAMAIENAKLYEKIEHLSVTDGLTNIYNHRYFQEALKNELNRLERYYKVPTEKVSLVILDIDDFKHYNDTNGHQAGDAVLVEIGQILKNTSRKVDIVARYGGEEFVAILPSTTKEGAIRFAERVRKAVNEHKFENGHKQPMGQVTVSLGVATFDDDGRQPQELIEIADKGLYVAKKEGKNKVCCINLEEKNNVEA